MPIRLSRGEYCLLKIAVHEARPFFLLPWAEFSGLLNETAPDLPREELIDSIQALFADGKIAAQNRQSRVLSMTKTEIAAALDEEWDKSPRFPTYDPRDEPPSHEVTFYLLTQRGGTTWEAFAKPRWDDFIDDGIFDYQEEIYQITCVNRERLERYFTGMYSSRGGIVDTNAVQWDTVAPWQATYWKALPSATRVRFRKVKDPQLPNWQVYSSMRDFYDWR